MNHDTDHLIVLMPTSPDHHGDTVAAVAEDLHDRFLEALYVQVARYCDAGRTLDEDSVVITHLSTDLPEEVTHQEYLSSIQQGAIDRNEPIRWAQIEGRAVAGVIPCAWAARIAPSLEYLTRD